MDTFTLDTLQKYIKCYKRDIVLKLANEKFTDKNISTQADLINMVLDYSPTVKSTIQFQFPDKINLSSLRTKPSIKKKVATSIKLTEINESREDEEGNSNSLRNSSQKEENKYSSNKDSSSVSYNSLKDEGMKGNSNLRDSTFIKQHSFDKIRLTKKNKIRIYVLSTSNYFEIEFSPEETIYSLKKKILNKLKNTVNINLKHNLVDAYEVRSTKDMNIIFKIALKNTACVALFALPSALNKYDPIFENIMANRNKNII